MMLRLDAGPREHDYTRQGWGHALHFPELVEVEEQPRGPFGKWFGKPTKRQEFRALGHGSVEEGDTILVNMASGRVARFVVRSLHYFGNPVDMFKIERADFLEYMTQGEEKGR